MKKLKQASSLFIIYGNNWLTILGAIAATVSGAFLVLLFSLDLFGLLPHFNAYLHLLLYLLLPSIFGFGLLAIPMGMFFLRLRKGKLGVDHKTTLVFPVLDLNRPKVRKVFLTVGLVTIVNIVIMGVAGVQLIEFSESVPFCGTVCHTPMEPEYVAHQFSPHSKVSCTACHVGPGAASFVKAKLNGLNQLFSMVTGSYPTPIPTPVHNLRAAKYTCEHCHSRSKQYSDRFIEHSLYAQDRKSTVRTIKMVMKLGTKSSKSPKGQGVHWHIKNPVWYRASDSRRQVIPWVKAKINNKMIVFTAPNTPHTEKQHPKKKGHAHKVQTRLMDCIDCHNRPTHNFTPPHKALDHLLALGKISRKLPYIKREGMKLLSTSYHNNEQAKKSIHALKKFYQKSYPAIEGKYQKEIQAASDAIFKVYKRTQFPKMKVNWKSYPDHIGHSNFSGCFRCHDGKHTSNTGRVIKSDCNLCHTLVGYSEKKNLYPKKHQVACTKCHDASASLQAKHRDIRPKQKQCLSCHKTLNKMLVAVKKKDPSFKASHECTTCHSVHNTTTSTKPDQSCLSCHKSLLTKNKQHAVHLKKRVACNTCHTTHQWKKIKFNDETACSACHVNKDYKQKLHLFRR